MPGSWTMLDYQSYVGTREKSLKTRYDFLMTWFNFNVAGTTRRRPCLCTLGLDMRIWQSLAVTLHKIAWL
jgi:hypothetical protein